MSTSFTIRGLAHCFTPLLAVAILVVPALGQSGETDSYWRNRGMNQSYDWEIGEIYEDISATISFRDYTYPSSPPHRYASVKGDIIKRFFDADQLSAFLQAQFGSGLNPHVETLGTWNCLQVVGRA